jgi:hypothetical protein
MDNHSIIVYMGGTCGDLVSALYDTTGAELTLSKVRLPTDRQRLKKPHTFANNQDKDQYLSDVLLRYRSIPSHDLEYHRQSNHTFTGITVKNVNVALWAAERFKALHQPNVWEEMKSYCGASTVKDYAKEYINYSKYLRKLTKSTISLEDILSGKLEQYLELDNECKLFYNSWLTKQEF